MSFKKTIIPLFICGIVLCLCSCAKEDEFEMPTLVLSESSVSFDKGVGERTISVTTNQNSWPKFNTHLFLIVTVTVLSSFFLWALCPTNFILFEW